MPLVLAAVAALVLTDIDQADLRCVWVTIGAATQSQPDENRSALMGMAYWFEGRLAGRHPDLMIQSYVTKNLTFTGAKATDADLKACADKFSAWQIKELAG